MSFLNPFFLFALAAVGIPVVIHLLNLRRPQKLPFSTLAFFNELQKTTVRRIRIKRYMLLMMRALAIICLALVLARPFLPPSFSSGLNESDEPTIIGFLIDNSPSMDRIDENGPLFDQAKELVDRLIDGSKDSDQYIIQFTNGAGTSSNITGRGESTRRMEEARLSEGGNFLDSRVIEMMDLLSEAPFKNKKLFILSDGQQSQFADLVSDDFENNSVSISLIEIGNANTQNTGITAVRSISDIISVGSPVEIQVSLKNFSERMATNQFLSLEFDNELIGQYAVELNPSESSTFSFQAIPNERGFIKAKVIVEGDEFTADNEYFFTVFVPEERKILWITPQTEVERLNSSYSELILEAINQSDNQLSYAKAGEAVFNSGTLGNYDTIILDGLDRIPEFIFPELVDLVQSGKGLIFFPSSNGDFTNYNLFLDQFNAGRFNGLRGSFGSFNSIASITKYPQGHPILDEVFELTDEEELRINNPNIYYNLRFEASGNVNGLVLLETNLSDIILYEQSYGQGKLFLFTLGNEPGWSDLPVNPLFAPLYYRTLLYASSIESGGVRSFELGEEFVIEIPGDNRDVNLDLNELRSRPEIRNRDNGLQIRYAAKEWSPGWLDISSGEDVRTLGVNYERFESDFTKLSESETISDFISDNLKANTIQTTSLNEQELDQELSTASFGREIWSWFMWLGFILLIGETIIMIWYRA